MRTTPSATLHAFWLGLLLLCCFLPLRAEQFGLFTYEVINGSAVEITDYPTNATGPVEIPAQIAGKPVTSIGSEAFSGCSGLTSVTIPASVANVGHGAFWGCTGLTRVTILSGVTSIDTATFHGCTGLTSITIPSSVTSIGNAALSGCTGLTSITIPSSVAYTGTSRPACPCRRAVNPHSA